MSKVVREDIDNLNLTLTVSLEPKDYEEKFLAELKKYRKEGSLKGFRKGKAPFSVLKKMFGKPVLAEVVNKQLNEAIFDFLKEKEVEYLGQPIPVEDHEDQEFDPRNLETYSFKFDLGLEPAFEVEGLGDTYEKLEVKIDDDFVNSELERAAKTFGEREQVSDDIVSGDLLAFTAEELEKGKVKEGGLEKEFTVQVEDLEDKIKKQVLKKKAGDLFKADLFKLEKNLTEKQVLQYFLGLKEDEEYTGEKEFQLTITAVTRIKPAELNKELFDKYFGPDVVSTVEEAKESLQKEFGKYYNGQAEALLFRDFQKTLMEKNQMELPDAFLKRWLGFANEDVNEDTIEKDYPNFAENLKWTLIRSKLAKKYDIQVSEEEVKQELINKAQQMIQMYGNQIGAGMDMGGLLEGLVGNMAKDEKEVRAASDKVVDDKVYEYLEKDMTIQAKEVSMDDMKEILDQARKEAEEAKNAASADQEEE